MLLSAACSMQAQIEVKESETDNDELTIQNEEGDEEEVAFPEAMTYNLDSLLSEYMPQTYLSQDNDCQMTSDDPVFSKEEYIDRLSRIPSVMELSYNDVVRKFIDRYTGRLRHSISYMLGAANFYMPIFEEALEAYQLPLELKYLPVIESALNPTAVSRAGATGLWQFMIGTAKQYDLEVNSLVDERRDPVKSSYAAARYLSDLYRIFGDWNLVIAAYNCGPDNINKAIHRAGGENKDYWYIYPYLPKETRGYVPAFIAANYVMNYYCEHNICPMTTRLPVKTDTVVINRQLHLKQIADVLDLDIDMVRALNPELRRDVAPGNSSPITIRLAQSDVTRFIDMQDSIFNYNTSELLPKRIETSINDDVPTVGRRKSARNQRSSRGRSRSRRSHSEATASSGSKDGGKTIVIRRGDTLGSIAKRNGTTVNELKRLNNMKDSKIRAGQSIKVK